MNKLLVASIALACVAPAGRAAYGLTYQADRAPSLLSLTSTNPRTRILVSGSLSASDEEMPEHPLAHPFKTFLELNRGGGKTLRGEGTLPYVLIGVAALATDKQTIKWFHPTQAGERRDSFAKTFSTIGSGKFIGGATLLLLTIGTHKEKDTGKLLLAAVGNTTVWTQAVKMLTGKPRPEQSNDTPQYKGPGCITRDSFPSGHTAAATTAAIVLGHRYPRSKLLFYSLATAVGVARIEGHYHFPSDVYWGAGFGYYGARQALRHEDAILRWEF